MKLYTKKTIVKAIDDFFIRVNKPDKNNKVEIVLVINELDKLKDKLNLHIED